MKKILNLLFVAFFMLSVLPSCEKDDEDTNPSNSNSQVYNDPNVITSYDDTTTTVEEPDTCLDANGYRYVNCIIYKDLNNDGVDDGFENSINLNLINDTDRENVSVEVQGEDDWGDFIQIRGGAGNVGKNSRVNAHYTNLSNADYLNLHKIIVYYPNRRNATSIIEYEYDRDGPTITHYLSQSLYDAGEQ